ncbi:hypothetical protein KXW65_008596 [Aspergillus fumigatus]|nr:hypothetical protein KXX58_001145 [Aspergillus fumigatus]KAH2102078.1 hypothetical protein KXW65_008596 [Aspergillus fumigatus]KAH2229231.1 hypothetical protein KXW71_008864 [Aspergillus fumigatus]
MSSESGSSSGAQLAKNFSRISLLGLAFITLNSWTAFSSALPLSLTSGGPTSIIWGLLTAGVCTLCTAASLAEFLSAYPTAAGRYRWVAGKSSCRWSTISLGWEDIDRYLRHFVTAVSWDDYERVLSWFTAWANVAAWICLCATASLFGSQLVTNTVILVHPDFNFLRWHVFLIYVGFNLIAFLVNAFWNSILSALNRAALIWSLCGFSIIFVTVLACASPNYNSARHVAVSIAYISFTTVLFMFPPARPVTGSTMNYAIAATGVFALLSAIYWFVRGRKHFMQVLVTAEMAIPEARPSSCPIKSDV